MKPFSFQKSSGSLVRKALFLLACLMPSLCTYGQTESEYVVKSAIVFNFLKFTEFPHVRDLRQLAFCLVSPTVETAAPFIQLSGQQVGARVLEVRLLNAWESPDGCAVIFFPRESDLRLLGAHSRKRGQGVLTIGETPGFASVGGIINLYSEVGRVRFEINPDNAASEGVRLSSRLLSLAKLVRNN